MCWTTTAEDDARAFFRAHYVLWVIGELEPEVERELDGLTNGMCENWKAVMQRELLCSPAKLRERFVELCETLTLEDAVTQLLLETEVVISEEALLEQRSHESSRTERMARWRMEPSYRSPG